MSRAPRFETERVIATPMRVETGAYWEFSGRIFSGDVHHYLAADGNLPGSGAWWFLVHVPDDLKKGGYVLLQALDYPRIEAWTPVARTVINFAKATMPRYRGMVYAKIRLSSAGGEHKFEGWTRERRRELPGHLAGFRIDVKSRVATTRGSDGDALVAVLPRHDHAGMIRLFFATKVWPLHPGAARPRRG